MAAGATTSPWSGPSSGSSTSKKFYISFPDIHLVTFQPTPRVWRAQLRLCVVHREQAAAAERRGGWGALRAPHLGAAVPPGPAHHTGLSLHPHQRHPVSGRLT